jgi:hypothetical protein
VDLGRRERPAKRPEDDVRVRDAIALRCGEEAYAASRLDPDHERESRCGALGDEER